MTSSTTFFLPRFDLVAFCVVAFFAAVCEDAVSFCGLDSWLLGALRSPSTFLGAAAGLLVFSFTSSSPAGLSVFSSRMTSEDAALDEALVVRVERVERVAFLTGMISESARSGPNGGNTSPKMELNALLAGKFDQIKEGAQERNSGYDDDRCGKEGENA